MQGMRATASAAAPRLLRPSAHSAKRSGKEPAAAGTARYFDPPSIPAATEPQAPLEASNFSEEVMKLAEGIAPPPQEGLPRPGWSTEEPPHPEEGESGGQKQQEASIPDALARGTCDMTGGDIFWHSKLDEVQLCTVDVP